MLTFLLILFVAICVYKLKICPINKYNEEPIDKKTISSLFGLSIILILYHHLSLAIGNVKGNTINFLSADIVGGIGVSLFFFICGFGLLHNHINNPEYSKSLIVKTIPTMYFVYLITNAIYVIYFACLGMKFSFFEVITNILGIVWLNNFSIINPYAWFIPAILIIYLAFFIIFYFGNKIKLNNMMCSILMVIFIVGFYVLNAVLPYNPLFQRGIFCFLIGISYALYYKNLNAFFKRHLLWCLFVIIAIFSINQWFFTIINKTETQSACVVCLIVLLLQKVSFGNLILSNIKRIGIEIYLLQFLFFHLFSKVVLIANINWYSIITLSCSIVASLILHWIIKYSKKGVMKIVKKIKERNEEPLIG